VFALVLAALLSVSDPVGDVPPPGYAWPKAEVYQEVGFADLVGFQAESRDGVLWIRFRLDRTPNPGGAPLGFSLAVLADFIDTAPGGVRRLPEVGFSVPEGKEPDVAVVVSGWGAMRVSLTEGGAERLFAQREGDWIAVNTGLPAHRYRHYPVVGLYDPFAPLGFRKPSPVGGLWRPKAPAGAPAAVDVLDPAAFESGVLYPSERTPRERLRPLVSGGLAVMAGLFFAWGAVGWMRRRRAQAND